jgi:hypothetical protein
MRCKIEISKIRKDIIVKNIATKMGNDLLDPKLEDTGQQRLID